MTGTSLFNGISQCEQLPAAIFHRYAGPVNNIQRDMEPRQMPHRLQQRIKFMKAAVSSQLSTAHRRYNLTWTKMHDRSYHAKLRIRVRRLPPIRCYCVRCCHQMANAPYTGLLKRTSGMCKILCIQRHKISKEETGTLNAVSIYHFTLSPRRAWMTFNTHKTTSQTMLPQHRKEQQQTAVEYARKATRNVTIVLQEYLVSPMMSFVNTPQGGGYMVWLY